ncbi:putative membrane copper amine oxidase [Trichoderma pleuroticola]
MIKICASRTFGLIICVCLAANISSYGYYTWVASTSRVKAHQQQSSPYPVCESTQPSHSTGLNLTTEDSAGSLPLELLAPNKSDVLLFINKKTIKPPPRYARATLMFGATPNPFLQDYIIGPLPITKKTQVRPLQFLYNNADKGKVAVDFADRIEALQFTNDVGLSVADITKLLWDGTLNDTLGLLPQCPPSKENGRLMVWSSFTSNPTSLFNSETILPLGLYFGLDITGRDPSKWSLIGWYYNGIYYPTTDAFQTAAMSSNFTVLRANSDGPWARLDKQGLFEFDQGYPIQRHSAANHTSITRNIAFIVRSVSTIANYDYMLSYTFFLDGSIEVSVRASGYILGGFSANNEEYGWTIHDNLSGSIHDHVFTYKADIDIFAKPRSTGPLNGAATYAIVNRGAKNTFGEYPGYKFSPATSNAIFLTVLNSSNAMNAVNFADHHFYVTKQKDTEAQATHPYNVLNPVEPIVDFAKFFDGESLDQENL